MLTHIKRRDHIQSCDLKEMVMPMNQDKESPQKQKIKIKIKKKKGGHQENEDT